MKRIMAAVASSLMGTGILMAASPVQADSAEGSPVASDNPHCIASVDTGDIECFDTFDSAMAGAESQVGRSVAEQEAAFAATSDEEMSTYDGNIIIATLFVDRDFGGATYTLWGTGATCTNGGSYSHDLPEDWHDRISSLNPWAGCEIRIYSEVDLEGDHDGPYRDNTPYVGDFMNDRTKSFRAE